MSDDTEPRAAAREAARRVRLPTICNCAVGQVPLCVKHMDIAGVLDAFAAARVVEEREVIMDWLVHRCDYGPPCERCTHCSVRRWIAARAPGGSA